MVRKLKLDFLSYWHVGNGLGEGAGADSVALKDTNGLPYFPGKALRGLLRNAIEKAQALDWLDAAAEGKPDIATLAFGSSHLRELTTRVTQSGQLYVSNACLPDKERGLLKQADNAHLVPALFSHLASTAIDETTGSAQGGSLRSFEVTVPLTLYADLTLNAEPSSTQGQGIFSALEKALPLLENIGAKRSRGFGRVVISLEELTEEVKHAN